MTRASILVLCLSSLCTVDLSSSQEQIAKPAAPLSELFSRDPILLTLDFFRKGKWRAGNDPQREPEDARLSRKIASTVEEEKKAVKVEGDGEDGLSSQRLGQSERPKGFFRQGKPLRTFSTEEILKQEKRREEEPRREDEEDEEDFVLRHRKWQFLTGTTHEGDGERRISFSVDEEGKDESGRGEGERGDQESLHFDPLSYLDSESNFPIIDGGKERNAEDAEKKGDGGGSKRMIGNRSRLGEEKKLPSWIHDWISISEFLCLSDVMPRSDGIIGFSLVRASNDSLEGVKGRIVFENTFTDLNDAWDGKKSVFKCKVPGLYFFSFNGRGSANDTEEFWM